MKEETLIRQFIREAISSNLVELTGGKVVEYGSQQHLDELEKMEADLKALKSSMSRGPERKEHRKERGRLQSAIESIRYLRRKAQRQGIRNGLLKT
jgi:hypothetical protein